MKTFFGLLLFLICFSLIISCQQKIDIEKEKIEILKLMKEYNNDMLNLDIDAVLSSLTQDSYDISRGEITKLTLDDQRKDFERLFKKGKYTEFEDIITPIIQFSNDGKMAWIIGKISYTYTYNDSTGLEHNHKGIDAYLQIAVKENNNWLFSDVAQTFKVSK